MTVSIRALEWGDQFKGYVGPGYRASSIVGEYLVEKYGNWCVYFNRQLISSNHPSAEAARAAAQADHDKRIRSALAPAVGGADLVARLREALRNMLARDRRRYGNSRDAVMYFEENNADAIAALALAEGQATEGMDAWHAHDLIPGRAYESQNWGTVKYAGLDTCHGETTHEFRGSMPCGGARYIKSEKLGEFLKPKLAAPAPAVQP